MKLKLIQERIAEALEADARLCADGWRPVAEDQGDVSARLNAAIARTSRCLLIQTPGFDVTSSASKVMVGEAGVVVQAIEHIVESRSRGGMTAQDAAELLAWTLNMLPLEGCGVLVCRRITSKMLDERTLAYAVTFGVQTTISDPVDTGKEEAV